MRIISLIKNFKNLSFPLLPYRKTICKITNKPLLFSRQRATFSTTSSESMGLTQAETEKLRESGCSGEQIQQINDKFVFLNTLNNSDDGYGLPPMLRTELFALATRKSSAKLIKNIENMQKKINKANEDERTVKIDMRSI